ncbi:protein ALP1-like [Beta vulgaris subsp. vulgaris]|uniref:protein ALP1-like n=1 Tax=Beta vulgaris subsp. vulgaris TaxID=3555 RepID=UPI00053F81E1|nr:protein ALP1-like [Beta vulgaris subsp. vulgaris]XP_010695375.1 protein ALP1-like [Beta vulgaris subsp. vulgaris]XP_010695376.1 protein ALP1-like [Beta vulgaris subsp. vulgaris]XP_019108272.1 protein ALP1-like [Beta vulgaris subsp. vulgaris]XP_048500456.1 protein ALP1-like [Beta vulgaris subsp. vulgaris]XP_048500457.1 protein ALP1-like [Beta vulgaris subsp. vulgaris]XP_057251119.1 protein ALP1-like [Beta vulgaris subsp. vulgaris]XP_057251120.1 protein ALP1-like [Beta vulgaris subsp. vulga
MDQTFLVMLSNLLHLQNHLDPTSSLFSSDAASFSSSSTTSLSSLLTSSTAAPLLFFTIASVLSFVAASRPSSSSSPSSSSRSPSRSRSSSPSDHSLSAFRALSTELIWSMDPPVRDAQWRSSYGLSYPVFTTVVDKLKPHIAQSNLSLPPDYAVAMVLSRLCHGLSAKTLAKRHSLDPYLVSKITNMVTRLLSTKLYPEFIKIPAGRRRLHETTQAFEEITSLPNLCGAIDSTPVRLHRLPADISDPSSYHCRYGFPAIQLQVVADHKKVFWDVCVKAPGSVDDATHFRDSVLYNKLMSGDVVWDKVVNVRGHPVRPYIVGDWCFPSLSFLLTPFSGNGRGTPAQNTFNAALMKGRSATVEAIGLLKGRWKILQDLNVGLHHAPQTIVACCVLHNLCQIAREPEPELYKEPEESGSPPRILESERSFYYYGENLRQQLADDLHQRLSSR